MSHRRNKKSRNKHKVNQATQNKSLTNRIVVGLNNNSGMNGNTISHQQTLSNNADKCDKDRFACSNKEINSTIDRNKAPLLITHSLTGGGDEQSKTPIYKNGQFQYIVGVVLAVIGIIISIYYGVTSISKKDHDTLVNKVIIIEEYNSRIAEIVNQTEDKVRKLAYDQGANNETFLSLYGNMNESITEILSQIMRDDNRKYAATANATEATPDKANIKLFEKPMPSPLRLSLPEMSLLVMELPKGSQNQPQYIAPENLPRGAKFDRKSSILTWQTWFDQAGSYDLVFTNDSQSITQTVTIDVEKVQRPEWFRSWIDDPDTKKSMVPFD
jgi:hypothetical protein